MISRLRAVSRLPVGSSASSSSGSVTMARAIATRCCWPPDSSAGVWCSRPARPTRCRACTAVSRRSRRGHAAVDERQFDVLDRRGAGEQIVALEHEAEVVAPEQRALIAGQPGDIDAVETVAAGGRPVEAADDVHGGGLAGARGPHDGDELAARDRQIDAGKGTDQAAALAIVPLDTGEGDEWRFRHGAAWRVPVMIGVALASSPDRTSVVLTVARAGLHLHCARHAIVKHPERALALGIDAAAGFLEARHARHEHVGDAEALAACGARRLHSAAPHWAPPALDRSPASRSAAVAVMPGLSSRSLLSTVRIAL